MVSIKQLKSAEVFQFKLARSSGNTPALQHKLRKPKQESAEPALPATLNSLPFQELTQGKAPPPVQSGVGAVCKDKH